MPFVRAFVPRGFGIGPGVTWVYPLDQVRREVAFIAYHFHWGHSEIMELPHPERVHWVGRIGEINQAILDA